MEIIGPRYRLGDTDLQYVIFPNGYSVHIRFGNSSNPYGGFRFDSKFRKVVLKDPEGKIISEITEKNPHQIPEDVRKSFWGW